MSTAHRLSLADYDRLITSGTLPHDRRLELIDGELREMSAIGPPHENVVDLASAWSFDHAPRDQVRVRVQNSIGLPLFDSAPEPDVVWVRQRDYSRGRPLPAEVLLLIEVADSSLDYDRGEKAALYAAAGITDYWVVNIPMKCIEVYRDPREGKYHDTRSYGLTEAVAPLAFPTLLLPVALLFGA